MSPNTTPIEPSARTQKRPDEWVRPSPSPLKDAGGRTSFERGWDMRKGESRGRRLLPGLQNGACLYSLIPETERARFSALGLTSRNITFTTQTRPYGFPRAQAAVRVTCSAISRATAAGFSTFDR